MEKQEGRLESIDALRGFDMLFIMGLAVVIEQTCVALGFGNDCWLAQQMRHPKWIGLTHHDTIFPLFIFIAGLSFPFSMAKHLERGRTKAQIAWRSLRRLVALTLLGMLYERYFMGEPFRFGSVLGRIGLAWSCASLLFLAFGPHVRAAVAAGVLLGYWALNVFVPAPGFTPADVFTPQGNIVCWVDRAVLLPLGRISPGTPELPFENQGLLSTLPAVVTAMLGMFTGEFVRWARGRLSAGRETLSLFAAAAALVAAGCVAAFGCGGWSFPISKPLWSTSFTLIVGGYSVAMFAVFHWLIDLRGCWRRTLFLRVVGLNAITIYVAQPLLGLRHARTMLFGRLAGLFPERFSGLVLAMGYLAMCWALLWFLHRRKIYLKV